MSHRTALCGFSLSSLLCLAAVGIGPAPARAGAPDSLRESIWTIEEAIDIAKGCVLDGKVSVVGSFIESARFERNPRGERGPTWRVTWAYSREIKGGQVFVTVFKDRTCELTFGE